MCNTPNDLSPEEAEEKRDDHIARIREIYKKPDERFSRPLNIRQPGFPRDFELTRDPNDD